MNTLQLIKRQINKASALHDAQITHTAYRGVKCEVRKAAKESHGTFCYPLFFCRYVAVLQMLVN